MVFIEQVYHDARSREMRRYCSFFWVNPRLLNFMCRRFGTLCSICTGGIRSLQHLYSDLLRAGRFGDRTPVEGDISRTHVDRTWGPPSLLYNGCRVSFSRVKRPGRDVNYPTPTNAEVKERVRFTYTPPVGLRRIF